jgi:uncharacterized protein (TIGR03067 family)
MKKWVTPVLVLVALMGADAPRDKVDQEKNALEGTWVVVKAELDGEAFRPLEDAKFVFSKGTLKVEEWGDWEKVTLKLDPSRDPKHVDFIPAKGGEKERSQGIYQLRGDTLKLCMAANDAEGTATKGKPEDAGKGRATVKPRPRQFDSKQGFLLTLKREQK